jgi:2-keto-4-pentenoate hydratase/2-oxohepta-3-ene-1,7-dioic acid hydratase in catechol pathway
LRLAQVRRDGRLSLAVKTDAGWVEAPGTLAGAAANGIETPDGEPLHGPEFGPLLDHPGKIICVGRNYSEHVNEMGNVESPWPETFLRLPNTVTGPYDEIKVPAVSSHVDYEGELAVVIGRGGRHIPAAEAEQAIFGYTIVNDVSIRDWQRRGQQWTPGKNFDGTLPVGPELVTADELDWRDLKLETRVNGEIVQSATTAQFIFDVPAVIEFVSSWLTLEPGDLICTGTPGGVGAARKPPLWLKPGDVVEVEIEGIGTLRNPVVADDRQPATDRWSGVASEA